MDDEDGGGEQEDDPHPTKQAMVTLQAPHTALQGGHAIALMGHGARPTARRAFGFPTTAALGASHQHHPEAPCRSEAASENSIQMTEPAPALAPGGARSTTASIQKPRGQGQIGV